MAEPVDPSKRTRGYGAAVVARMTSKGQLTVPKAVREFMDLQAGDAGSSRCSASR